MTHDALLTSIYTKLLSISGLPKIIPPNRKSEDIVTNPSDDYIQAFVIPAPTETKTIDGVEYQYGFFQVDCVTTVNKGEIKIAAIAQKILTSFKNGTVISGGLRVHKPSYASGGMQMDGHYKIPVTVRYQCYSKD